jgi:hypothetical protein
MRALDSGLHWIIMPFVEGTVKWDQLASRLHRSGTERVPAGTLQQLRFVTMRYTFTPCHQHITK